MNARQMLAGLPVRRFAEGGDVTDAQIRDFLAANAGASDAQIAQVMNQYGVTPARLAAAAGYDPQEVTRRYEAALPLTAPTAPPAVTTQWQPGESIGRQRAIESGNETNWLAQVKASADAYMARATPATAAEAYDAMVQSGIGIKDLLDAGVSQMTIDKALSIETDAEQKAVNTLTQRALTNTLAQNPNVAPQLATRGAQDVYAQSRQFLENLQKDGLTDDERRYLQQVASQQGWGYSDIRAAGVDPSILFASPAAAAPAPAPVPVPAPVTRVFPQPEPYTPVTVYDPEKFAREKGADDLYAKGQPALDTAFRESPVRTVSPVTGQYMYTPAAQLRPATGSGWSWAPPVVTSRPRQLLDVGPTASESQLYALSRQEQDRALRNAFSSANMPATGQDLYYWQSRLRGGDYTSKTGVFDPTKFRQDFQSWSASRGSGTAGTSGAPQQSQQTFDEFGNPIAPADSGVGVMQPNMFLGFADGGDVRARELLDRLKKPEGTEERSLGAEESSYAPAPGESVMGNLSKQVGRGARALRDIAVNLTPLSQMEKDATRISLEHFPDSRQYGGESDALRHMLFQAQAVQRFGQPAAKALSLINEYGLGVLEAQPREHIRMDLENDALGREIGLSDLSEEEKLQAILDLIRSGKAVVLNPQQQEQEFAEGGLATAPSPRMARAAQLAAQRAEQPQTESRSMLERLQRFTSLDQPQDMSLGETVADIGMGFLPVVGTAQGARDFERARRDEDKLGMLLSAASMIPVAGGLVRGARSAGKAADDLAELPAQVETAGITLRGRGGREKEKAWIEEVYSQLAANPLDPRQRVMVLGEGDNTRYAFLELAPSFSKKDAVDISWINTYPQREGAGTEAIKKLQELASNSGLSLTLSPWGKGRISKSALTKFYKKLGFVQDKGSRDMTWTPDSAAAADDLTGTQGFAKGGEVSASPTPEELLAQIDRSMASSPASAQGTASSAQPDTVQGDSRSMLRRISDTFGKNVTAPVVGSMLDMTVGVGDLAQMGIKAGAKKLGVETQPFTPVSSAIQESLGVAGYDPYSPAAIATAIGLPAAAALRAAGTAARGSRPLMSAAMPRTPSGRRPAPGSAEELFSRLAPIVDREAAVFASSELAAMGAREVAPDNFTAEVAAAIAGGGAYNTLDNILSSVAPTTARSQMAEIYPHTPTRENPFVGRIDTYVANLPGRIGRDELLAQMQGKFRNADILRVRRALEDVDPKAKLQPNEILEKIKQEYDPSDLRVTTIAPGQFREKGLTFFGTMDNPWRGMPPELAPEQGVIVLSRPPVSGVRNYTRGQVRNAEAALSNFNLMVASLNEDMDVDARQQLFNSFSEPLSQALYSLEDFGEDKRGELFVLLDKVGKSAQRAEDIFHLGQRALSRGQDLPPDALNEEKNKLLARGGLEPSQVLDQAYANVFKRKFEKEIAEASGMANFPATRRIIQSLPTPDNVTNAQQASEFLLSTFMPAITREVERARQTQGNLLVGFIEEIRDSGVDKSLRQVIEDSKAPARAGVNPGYVGQHSSLTGTEGGQIGFSRTSDVVASLPNMSYARGIYLHEMQSDLLDDISTTQGRIASGATLTEVKNSIQRLEEKFSNSFKEKAGDSFSNSPEDEEVMERFLRDVLNDPEDRRGTVELYSRTYPQIFSPNLLYWLSGEGYKNVLKPLQRARERAEQLEQPEANRRARTSGFSLDEAFPGMMSDSKTLQQMFMKTAVRSAMDRGMNFVALTIPERPYSSQPQLYERVPQNARDVVKDLGEGFRLEQIRMRSPRDYSSNSFPVLAITWDQSTAEGREGVNRIMTQGVPFRHGGEVTTQPDDLKNLLSFLDKKPAHKRK